MDYAKFIGHMFKRLFDKQSFGGDFAILISLSVFKLLIHLFTNSNYGFHRDEFYYIACGNHLAWGFVDHPPLVPLITVICRWLLGDSLFAYRFLPALAGSLTVFLAGLTARNLGGKRFAQVIAALAVIIAPSYLCMNGILTTNAFDQLFWVMALFVLLTILKRNNPRYWLLMGAVCGIAILNKYTMLLLCFALAAAMGFAIKKALLLNRWFIYGLIITAVIVLPNLVWQINNGFPTVEFIKNAMEYKMAKVSPVNLVLGEIFSQNPISLPIWLMGLYFFLFSSKGKQYRIVGFAYLIMFAVLAISQKSRTNYLAPVYPILFAGGALVIESSISKWKKLWPKPAIIIVLIIAGVIAAPLSIPVLPVEKLAGYTAYFDFTEKSSPDAETPNLPPVFADMFGFPTMVSEIAAVYNTIPESERYDCAIFADNYGEAAAIDYLGTKYGLPKAICSHNSYFMWGPREYTGKLVISVGIPVENLKAAFESVTLTAIVKDKYATRFERNLPICICKNLRIPFGRMWPNLKNYY
jgi:hypothetical protein